MTHFNRGFPLQPFRLLGTPSGNVPPASESGTGNVTASVVFSATAVGVRQGSGTTVTAAVAFAATCTGTNPGGFFGPWFFTGTETDTNGYGGSFTDTNQYGGTVVIEKAGYGGTFTDTNQYGGTANAGSFGNMQAVNITLGEFNDETIDLAITNNSSAFNLAGFGLQVLFKTSAGIQDTDASTLLFSTSGISPAITITNASGGLAVLVIPHSALATTAFGFWRCDVTQSGMQATAMYGSVTIRSL